MFLFLAAIFSLFLPWVPPWISTFHCSSKHLWWYKVRSPVFNKVVWIRPHPLMFWYILSHRELEVIIISDCWPGTNASRLLLFIKTWTQGFSKINEQIITICITTELAWVHIENLSVWDKTIFLTSTCTVYECWWTLFSLYWFYSETLICDCIIIRSDHCRIKFCSF